MKAHILYLIVLGKVTPPPCLSLLMWDIEVAERGWSEGGRCLQSGTWGKSLLPILLALLCCLGLNWVNTCDCIRQNVCKYKMVINEKYSLFGVNELCKYVFLEVKCYI